MRIVSLLPSATEIVHLLGRGEHLVGRSHECDDPAQLSGEPRARLGKESDEYPVDIPILTAQRLRHDPDSGADASQIDREVARTLESGESLSSLNAELLEALRPDVILTQDLRAVRSIDPESVRRTARRIGERAGRTPEIVSLNPRSIEDMLDDVLKVGRAIGAEAAAARAVVELRDRLWRAQEVVNPYTDGPVVGFLEWTDPLFIAGHWTAQMIERAGGRCPLNATREPEAGGSGAGMQAASRRAGPSRRVGIDEFVRSNPEIIIIAPCGLDLERTRAEARRLSAQGWFCALPAALAGNVALVDGNQMFSRPGPRLADAFEFLVGYLHDRRAMIPEGFPWEPLA